MRKNVPTPEFKNKATTKEIQNEKQIGQESSFPIGKPKSLSPSIAMNKFSLPEGHSDLKIFSQIKVGRYEQNHP